MLRSVKHRWRNWRDARSKQDLFLRLDDHLLKDIGLFRDSGDKKTKLEWPQF